LFRLQQRTQRKEHPRLPPTHIGRFDGAKRKHAIIKVTRAIPHMLHRPIVNFSHQANSSVAQMPELKQRDDALRDTMYIDRIHTIVKIFWRAIPSEKMFEVKRKSTLDGILEFIRVGILANRPQAAQIITRVKIIDPLLRLKFSINP